MINDDNVDTSILFAGLDTKQLEEWNRVYNYVRPHQSLKYLTPHEFYQRWLKEHKLKRH